MSDKIFKLLEFLPLIVFLAYGRGIDAKVAGSHWKDPFLVGGGLALTSTIILVLKKIDLNRILLGINAFLISGAVAFLLRFWWLLNLYWKLKATAMFAWVIVVGIVAILISPKGFIGIHHSDQRSVRIYSVYLLLVAIAAFGTSYFLSGKILISDVVPFIALFVVKDLLKSRLSDKTEEHTA